MVKGVGTERRERFGIVTDFRSIGVVASGGVGGGVSGASLGRPGAVTGLEPEFFVVVFGGVVGRVDEVAGEIYFPLKKARSQRFDYFLLRMVLTEMLVQLVLRIESFLALLANRVLADS